ncbi:hypothetical protein M404DRAFT_28709 [Pisolithus tinctorius Marx 270]|uniref:Uncharacterized protein n=1 Tax=Pisolithus tinctorius Marx 270 TaxID=870435 RepID=A0A0C3P1N4_PISTI|nr:hypothetical protein M404DRAFT_28709 [Pisolithus tinctorius Marx 270]
MSDSRLIVAADNNDEGWVVIDWTQMPDDDIRYDTDDEEEVMKAKAKERKRRKAAEQAWQEEQAWLEAEAHEEEEKRRAEEEKEAEHKHKAEAMKGDEAGAGSSETAKVKKVVMDPGCTCCAWVRTICEFLMDGNKKWVACIRCNQSKGKCQWPGDGKDAKASPKSRVDKGKKCKADDEMPEPGPSQKKWAKSKTTEVLEVDETEASGSGLQEAVVENSGRITDALEAMLDESYGFRVVVTPLDSGSSELDAEELCEEAAWLQAEAKGEEDEEAEGEDKPMAKAE